MDLLKTGLLDGNPLEVQGTTYDSFPVSPLLIVPEVITPSLELNFATGKQLDSRITFSRGSSGTFINENGNVVGKTPGTTSSITPSTTAIGSQVTVTVASGSVVGWAVGQAISLIVDTDGQDDPDAGELWLLGDIVSSTLTTLTFTVTSRTATAGSATSWTLGYRGARFTHNPSTLASLGLLIEESRTNLFLLSEEFNDAYWNKARCSISANATTAPDGATTADKIVEDTSTGSHEMFRGISVTSGQAYTFSFYIKQAGRSRVLLQLPFNFQAGSQAIYDVSTGTVVSTGAAATASISAQANGFYRCIITATANATSNATIYINLINTGTTTSYTGDGSSGVFVWGAQVEAGAFATSYIPTTSATVTRAADVATMTGSNFSSWYNSSQGDWVANFRLYNPLNAITNAARVVGGNNNSAPIGLFSGSGGLVFSNDTAFSGGSISSLGAITSINASVSYTGGNSTAFANGVKGTTATYNASSLTSIAFGSDNGNAQFLNGTISRVRYYRSRLSDDANIRLTK